MNIDAPWQRGFAALQTHMQHTVTVISLSAGGIDVFGQTDDALEAALKAFVDVHGRRIVGRRGRRGAFTREGLHPTLDTEFAAGWVHARLERVDLD